ncbi:hypothetical protein [Subtercola boreus]|uniref:hypothetical protein n=1 Tax=Subtercola boreus TaxID=120213 RepID=UPI0015584533|nr:hypothetical protein [Subtercola boreus]
MTAARLTEEQKAEIAAAEDARAEFEARRDAAQAEQDASHDRVHAIVTTRRQRLRDEQF